jgi:hypothetical protein
MTNAELIEEVQRKLVVMAEIVRVYEAGKIDIAVGDNENEEVALSPQNKAQIRQKLTGARVACITNLNQIQVN